MENNNLNTFRVLFIIKGVFNLLITLATLFYVFLGRFIGNMTETAVIEGQEAPPFDIGAVFETIGLVGFTICLGLTVCTFLAANYINKRSHLTFIMVIAILNVFTGILGILLCIFTLIELTKPHVKALFQRN